MSISNTDDTRIAFEEEYVIKAISLVRSKLSKSNFNQAIERAKQIQDVINAQSLVCQNMHNSLQRRDSS